MIWDLLPLNLAPKWEEFMSKSIQVKNKIHLFKKNKIASSKKNSNQNNLMRFLKRTKLSLERQILNVRLQLHPIVVIHKS